MADDPLIGSVLSQKYLVLRFIGRGGMGRVYEATHEGLGRKCALKVLSSDLDDDGSLRERFLWEPRMASEFDHPNIIRVTDVDEDNGRLYIVMDLVKGSDLRTILRGGPIAPDRALRLVGQAADALDHAHTRGLIHRDVKPANILVGETDHVVLTDFGLAKSASRAQSLTVSGGFFGSISYAAPEQFDARGAEPASDRYALACVLWECLTGKAPFAGASDLEVIRGHLDHAVPRVGGDLPPALDDVFARGLAKDPAARYATGRALVDEAMTALADEERGHTRAIPKRPERPSAPAAAGPVGTPAAPAAAQALEPLHSADLSQATARYQRPLERPPAVVPAPEAGPSAARRLGRALRRPVMLGVIALPIAAVGGVALGSSSGSTKHLSSTRTVTQAAPAPTTITAHGLAITLPATWAGGSLPAALATASKRAGLFARRRADPDLFLAVLAPAPTLWLPAGTKAEDAVAVTLGSREVLRFDPIAARLGQGPRDEFLLAPYVASTSRGNVVIACGQMSASSGGPPAALDASFVRECERLASTVRISGARPLALLPLPKDVQAARAVLHALSASRLRADTRLRSKKRVAQIAAATTLATSYGAAARRIGTLRPALGIRGARAQVLADLHAEARAFTALAAAGTHGSAARWGTTVAAVGRQDSRLRNDLQTLDAALAGKAYAPIA